MNSKTEPKKNINELKSECDLPFAMQVAENPRIKIAKKIGDEGIIIGNPAMMVAGAQSEFIAANITQANALRSAVILRASDPPQYNKRRSPKSGVNLTKTSKQGFFKGALSKELRFARLEKDGQPTPHHPKDEAHLKLSPTDPDYQHTMQLDITMRDILREVGSDGDLDVLGFDELTGLLRLAYKEGRGPQTNKAPFEGFNGQFIIKLNLGDDTPQFYSRDWDRPENDPNWDPTKQIIQKPLALAAVPNTVYERVFQHSFYVAYTESKDPSPMPDEIVKAMVFANRPRTAEEFKLAMGDSPYADLISDCFTLPQILGRLQDMLTEQVANQVILEIYDRAGSIVAGDWDGMALGHPPDLNPQFSEVIDTFSPGIIGIENQKKLLMRAQAYLDEIKKVALQKQSRNESISAFEEKALSIPSITVIVSDFSLASAGCITPHEFVFQQVLNDAYRDNLNQHYGEKYNNQVVQQVMDRLLPDMNLESDEYYAVAKQLLTVEFQSSGNHVTKTLLNKLSERIACHLSVAKKIGDLHYKLPHLGHDVNVRDLYQHGFDMRNPYGSNLEGAWLLISEDGGIIYGDTQEQLIEVLLTNDFLQKNHIDVSHGADMAVGWSRVIERQIEFKQTIPAKTLEQYNSYVRTQRIEQFSDLKNQVNVLKDHSTISENSTHINYRK